MRKLIMLLAVASVTASCGEAGIFKKKVVCSDEAGVATVQDILRNEVERRLLAEKDEAGVPYLDAANVRATLDKLSFSFEHIRTSKTDPNSTKVFCEANYKVSIPSDMYKQVNDALQVVESGQDVVKVGAKYGFESNANSFSKGLSYSLQPTDDKKSIFAEVTDTVNSSAFISDFTGALLMRPILEAKLTEERKQQEVRRQAEEKAAVEAAAEAERIASAEQTQKIRQQKAALELARQENRLAKTTLNNIWALLPKQTQDIMTPAQTAWVTKRKIDCQVEASFKSTDPAQHEVEAMICETKRIQERINVIRGY